MARTLEPTLHAVDGVCAEVRRRLKPRVSSGDWYGVELLLREALTNAVLHGGGRDPLRRVRCEVRVGARGARMAIADDGPGFDWRAALAAEPAAAATSGRGLKIYTLYADRVSFNRRGNRVVLERRFESRHGGRKTSGKEAR
jgi:anti-sigma regulatory factor (Ser/Thr protein kinase)